MSDDKTLRGAADRRRIDIEDENEVRYWSEVLGITPDRLRVIVGKVGPMADRVRQEALR
jgi:hypothetical protein